MPNEGDWDEEAFDDMICTNGDSSACTSWGNDCCASMDWGEEPTCADGYFVHELGNCIYRCIPNDCGEWQEPAPGGVPIMDFGMPYQETPFMNFHSAWEEWGLPPMSVWMLPGMGAESTGDDIPAEGVFAIGWMYSDSPDGTGVFYTDDEGGFTWYVNNVPS